MDIREITLEQALPVRHNVLWPNKPLEFCMVDGDENGIHFGAYFDGSIVSTASIYISSNEARLRKFATLASYQGQGIGTAILGYILKYLREKGITYFWCDARESAIGFYQRFGLDTEGERFYKSDVAYFRMSVILNKPAALKT